MPGQETTKTEQTFLCEQCSKPFTRKQNLDRHKKIHIEKAKFVCNVCEMEFTRNDNLDSHERTVHATNMKANGLISSAIFESCSGGNRY